MIGPDHFARPYVDFHSFWRPDGENLQQILNYKTITIIGDKKPFYSEWFWISAIVMYNYTERKNVQRGTINELIQLGRQNECKTSKKSMENQYKMSILEKKTMILRNLFSPEWKTMVSAHLLTEFGESIAGSISTASADVNIVIERAIRVKCGPKMARHLFHMHNHKKFRSFWLVFFQHALI